MQDREERRDHALWLPKSVVTMEVLYWMPMHPHLLQSFIWQTDDHAPRFPRIARFLDHWRREIDAAIHTVSLAHNDGQATRWTGADLDIRLQ